MRISPIPPAQATRVSSWVTLRLALIALVAVMAGMMPDLWPYLRVSAASAPVDVPENAIYKVEQSQYALRTNASAATLPAGTQTAEVQLPFGIPFYGTSYSKILLSDDGYVAFDPTAGVRKVDALPAPSSSTPQRALLAFHAELNSTVKYWWEGAAPNRVLIVDWSAARYVYGAGNASPMSFQAQLSENGAPPVVMYTSTYGPPADARPAPLPLNGSAKLVTGVDAGDVDSLGARKNYTLWFAANSGQNATMTNFAVAYMETAGPTTSAEIELVPGAPLVGQAQQLNVHVTAGGLPVVGDGGSVKLNRVIPGQNASPLVAPVVDGVATFTVGFDIAAMHAFGAEFTSGPSPHYQPTVSPVTYVTPAFALQSSIDLTVDVSTQVVPPPPINARIATWTALITAPGRVITDGSVRFTSNNVVRGTVPVVNGQAVLTQSMQDGTHTITAAYLPSNALIIPSSITKVIDSGNASVVIEPFVLDNEWLLASVSASGNVSGGTVAFALDGVPVGDAPVVRVNDGSSVAVIRAPSMAFPITDSAFIPPGMSYKVDATFSGSPTSPPGRGSRSVTVNRTPLSPTTFAPPTVNTTMTTVSASGSGTLSMTASVSGTGVAGGKVLFFVDGQPVGLSSVSGSTASLSVPVSPGPHMIRAAFLGRLVNSTTYTRPSSGTTTLGSYQKLATTTDYTLDLGTRLGQPVWTMRASVSGGNVTGGIVTVHDPMLSGNVSAPVVNGEAVLTFTTPSAATNNQALLTALTAAYSGSDRFQGSNSAPRIVRGYSTVTTAVPVNASGGTVNPDYTSFDATVRMRTFENIFDSGGGGGSLQVRDGQGGELLSDTLIDFVGQTTERVTSSHAVPLTMIAYSGQLTQLPDGSYKAILPSGAYVRHPQAQSRMTQHPSETPYEWIHLSQPTVTSRCDDCYFALSSNAGPGNVIPWPVRFLDKEYPTVFLNNNGLLSFKQGISAWDGTCPPIQTEIGPVLAGFWADHDTRAGGSPKSSGPMSYAIVGQAPNRTAVFQWDSVNFYPMNSEYAGTPAGIDDQASFQIHVFEDNRAPRVALRNGPPTKGLVSNIFPVIGVDYGDLVRADLLQCTTVASQARHFVNEAYQFQLVLTNTKVTIEPSQNPAYVNQPISFTTRVDVGGLPAAGTTTFTRSSNGSSNGTPVVLTGIPGVDGEVVYTDTPPTLGFNEYKLTFTPNVGEPYTAANASVTVPVVTGPMTRMTLVNTPAMPVYGQDVTLTSSVSNTVTGNPVPAGLVVFKAGATTLGNASVSNGVAAITVRPPNGGLVAVTGHYNPGAVDESSTTIGMMVQPRPAVVKPSAASVAYGAPTPAIAYVVSTVPSNVHSGLAPGDTAAAVIGVTISSNRTATSPVGSYSTTANVPAQTNYQVLTEPGVLVVEQAGLTAIGPNLTKVFGAANPPLAPISYVG
ncbi:MAG TPA: Ig-like domain repeat protein, partial [Vicinamibacterales bacterium]|nr:Ig-like domain repeat protein [Vicinamibacterales bacterium]